MSQRPSEAGARSPREWVDLVDSAMHPWNISRFLLRSRVDRQQAIDGMQRILAAVAFRMTAIRQLLGAGGEFRGGVLLADAPDQSKTVERQLVLAYSDNGQFHDAVWPEIGKMRDLITALLLLKGELEYAASRRESNAEIGRLLDEPVTVRS